jgi:hypothetical protein
MLVRYHLQIFHARLLYSSHALTTLVSSSLFVCVSRDPSTVRLGEDCADPSEEVELRHALMNGRRRQSRELVLHLPGTQTGTNTFVALVWVSLVAVLTDSTA